MHFSDMHLNPVTRGTPGQAQSAIRNFEPTLAFSMFLYFKIKRIKFVIGWWHIDQAVLQPKTQATAN